MLWKIQEEVPNISFPTKEQDDYFISLLKRKYYLELSRGIQFAAQNKQLSIEQRMQAESES